MNKLEYSFKKSEILASDLRKQIESLGSNNNINAITISFVLYKLGEIYTEIEIIKKELLKYSKIL